jgi:nucleoside-diphosphate-sugar epimerase
VIHTAYVHDFSQMEAAAATDRRVIETLGRALESTGKPLVVTTGTGVLQPGRPVTEDDRHDPSTPGHPRRDNETVALQLADRGVRTSIIRPAPTVHGDGDHGFVARLVEIARDRGASGYVGDGANRWAAVHRLDAAHLYRLALEHAPAASVFHAVGEAGVPTRDIAEVISRHLSLPLVSVDPDRAADHFGWLGAFFSWDAPASNALTRERLGWEPTHQGLIADLEAGFYFEPAAQTA